MHRLFLLRHAVAGWAAPGVRDFDRPLTARGRADAEAVGKMMRERGYMPDMVLCSSAQRTRETWSCLALGLGIAEDGDDVRKVMSEAIYNGDACMLLDMIRDAPAAASMLVVGHNPTMAELAASIPGRGKASALRAAASGFPEAALAVIATSEPLSELSEGSGTLEAFLRL